MSDDVKATTPEAVKRWKTVSYFALLAGVVAAVVGAIGVLREGMSAMDLLLFGGGMLVAVLGMRGLRRSRTS